MGLDMNIVRFPKGMVKPEWCNNDEGTRKIYDELDEMHRQDVAYWRKFNALHGWFVNNVAGGQDECNISPAISREEFETLLATLDKAHDIFRAYVDSPEGKRTAYKNIKFGDTDVSTDEINEDFRIPEDCEAHRKLEKVFPTCPGFFFGGTEYNWYYLENVDDARKNIRSILDDFDFDEYTYHYWASW